MYFPLGLAGLISTDRLFKLLDGSKSTIALLSPDYIKSKVCYEEFNLSHALFVDKDRTMDLVSVLVEPIGELPLWCAEPLPVDCASSQVDMAQVLATVCTDLVKRLKGKMPFLSIYRDCSN